MSASAAEGVIHYSRGRDKFDAYPSQHTAESFAAFAKAVLADRSAAKGLTWFAAPFAQNGDGRHHRCKEGVLPRRFLAFDLDGGTREAAAELGLYFCGYSGFWYTTSSHTAETSRLRYVLELTRAVDRAEGIRVGVAMQRQIEVHLGLVAVNLDPSVYRGEQPVFGPLQNSDVGFYGGDPVDVDAVLKDAPPLEERPGRAERAAAIASRDPVVRALADHGMIKKDHGDGKVSIVCPFEGEHTEPGGESSTCYFLPNFGGVKYGKLVCLHSHCEGRQQGDYLIALGLEPREVWREQANGAAPYDDLPPVEFYCQEDARRNTEGAKASGGSEQGTDDGKAVNETAEQTIARLASMTPMDYDRVREAEAKRLGIRVATLDGEVTKARESINPSGGVAIQGQAVVFDDPEPWPDEVDGATAVSEVSETLSGRLSVPDGAADTMALWTMHAHCHMAFLHSPRLNITSPEKGCGKTLALDVLSSLAPKPIRMESLTTPVLFRIVDKFTPTLFIDEYDAFIHDNEELRGALNAGHKRGGMHLRCEGDKNEVRGFRTFAPVALAGIHDLPGTLADRSIIVRMQRMGADERREPFDQRRTEPEKILCRKLARWASDNFRALEAADPEMPAGAGHRVRDNWRPLFAIADQAGGDWPKRVRRAFVLLGKPDDAARSRSEMLLSDFRDMFAEHGDRILSADAVKWLGAMEERPWPEYSRSKPITARQVAAALRRFEIKPVLVRVGTEVARGYVKDDFTDAFARYL